MKVNELVEVSTGQLRTKATRTAAEIVSKVSSSTLPEATAQAVKKALSGAAASYRWSWHEVESKLKAAGCRNL